MDDQERYDRFLSALGFRAGVTTTPAQGIDLVDLDGEPIDPAVRLHVCPQKLAAHVCDEQGVAPGGHMSLGDEPDDLHDPEADSLQSLLAQIEEAILLREPGHDHLVLVDGGVRAVSADQVPA